MLVEGCLGALPFLVTVAHVVAGGGGGGACWEGPAVAGPFPFAPLGWSHGGLLLSGIGVVLIVDVSGVRGCWFASVEGPVDRIHYPNHNLTESCHGAIYLGCHGCDQLLQVTDLSTHCFILIVQELVDLQLVGGELVSAFGGWGLLMLVSEWAFGGS